VREVREVGEVGEVREVRDARDGRNGHMGLKEREGREGSVTRSVWNLGPTHGVRRTHTLEAGAEWRNQVLRAR